MANTNNEVIGDGNELIAEIGPEEGAVDAAEPQEQGKEDPAIAELFGEGEQAAEAEPQEGEAEEAEEPIEGPDGAVEETVPQGRAGKRIQTLVGQVRDLETRLQSQQTEMIRQFQMQQTQQYKAYQDALAEQKRQADIAARQLELLQARREKEEDAELSPIDRLRKQAVKEALGQAKQEMEGELSQLRQEVERERQAREQLFKKQESQARLQKYSQMTQQATHTMVLKSVAEPVRAQLGPAMSDMLLTFCAATGQSPEQAAPQFAQVLESYHKARLEATNPAGQKVKAAGKVPAPAPDGRRGSASVSGRPSWSVLRENGYKDYIEWRAAGAPALKKRGA